MAGGLVSKELEGRCQFKNRHNDLEQDSRRKRDSLKVAVASQMLMLEWPSRRMWFNTTMKCKINDDEGIRRKWRKVERR